MLDRFTQIKPKVIFAADGYFYNGKAFNSIDKLLFETGFILAKTSSTNFKSIDNSILWQSFLDSNPESLFFEQLPFDHPIYIMYSSGTTGKPKSIVHGAGGTLIQHLKELRLHSNISSDLVLFLDLLLY